MTVRATRDRASSSCHFNGLMAAQENPLSLLPDTLSPLACHLQTLVLISRRTILTVFLNRCPTTTPHFKLLTREAGSEAGNQRLTHLKPWFRQSGETLMSVRLWHNQFAIQLRPQKTPFGAKTIKSKPKVLTNSRYCWGGKQGTTRTNFYQQQKEQDTVKTTFTSKALLIQCGRQGRSWQYPRAKLKP